jgi:hypothetical protein
MWPQSAGGGRVFRCNTAAMRRRSLLLTGAGAGLLLAVGGVVAVAWEPGMKAGRLSAPASRLMSAVARAVLEGSLPEGEPARAAALLAHQQRVEASIAGLAPATRKELSDLLALLCTSAGRWALTGLSTDWPQASTAEVRDRLQAMRLSSQLMQRQIYQALRELTSAAWFADAGTWVQLGYPGPQPV